jgi:hypothetical protein
MHTKTLAMARDKVTRKNFVVWYREEFGFTHGGQDDLILSAKLIRIPPETSSF